MRTIRAQRRPSDLTVAQPPEEDALEGEEVGAGVLEAREEPLPVAGEEAREEVGGEALRIVGEERPLHPLDDVGRRAEVVPVDLEARLGLVEAEAIEEHAVLLHAED